MKVAQLAVLGVAVVASGGAFFVGNNLLRSNNQPVPQVVQQPAAPEIELDEVLVAAQEIPLGTSIQPDMLEWKKWPSEGLGEDFISRDNNPEGINLDTEPAIARAAFFAGEPIREIKLVRADKGYMSAILPKGQKAIATSISTTSSAGGFILPNDRVDVIMTRRDSDTEIEQYITETILENVRVLAIDQTIEEQNGEAVVVGETATLQLSGEQAKILTVAQEIADRMTLALRSLEDSTEETTTNATNLLSEAAEEGIVNVIKFGKAEKVKVE